MSKHIVHISTNISKSCEHCTVQIGGDGESLAEAVNHYVDAHGYKIIHIGTETIPDSNNGGLWHTTVAIVGK